MRYMIGIDVGGTFTDLTFVDVLQRHLTVHKLPSTPHNPSEAIITGIREVLASQAVSPESVDYLAHGTTVATNALIERTGARTGLIVTTGFRDLLEIGDQTRPSLYNIRLPKPEVFVPGERRLEVRERVYADGRVRTPLDPSSLQHAISALKAADVEAVAICFLFSYVNAEHEEHVRAAVQEALPDVYITASHEIVPEFREYARLSTTVLNAYLGPVMRGYILRLAARLRELGVDAIPHLTQSNGGVIGFDMAARLPVRTVLSGPSTGVVAAQAIGAMTGIGNLITFDMGGTSTDVALIENGRARLASEMEVHGYPLKTPMLDIHTVGAGGGSIAHIDAGGHLKVGPRSAGSVPGPVCYGLGNTEPTVTDANVALGTLHPTHLLAGRMPIDRRRSLDAIKALSARLGLDPNATADGIIAVVTANMAKAIRVISVQRGHDPRDYVLVAFGGAGPLHAGRLARELEMPRILVPRSPGILCALGLLLSDLRTNYALTRQMTLTIDRATEIAGVFAELESRARRWFEEEGIAEGDRRVAPTVDIRYAGQNYELSVPVPAGASGEGLIDALRHGFEEAHRQMYGYVASGETIQAITFRLEAIGKVRATDLRSHAAAADPVAAAEVGVRDVWIEAERRPVSHPVYDRERLAPGHTIRGPAIVEQMDATTVILAGQTASVDAYLNIIVAET